MTTSAVTLILRARAACAAVAEGEFTPVVFERYEFIGGERGVLLGYPSQTQTGAGCIVWLSKQTEDA